MKKGIEWKRKRTEVKKAGKKVKEGEKMNQ